MPGHCGNSENANILLARAGPGVFGFRNTGSSDAPSTSDGGGNPASAATVGSVAQPRQHERTSTNRVASGHTSISATNQLLMSSTAVATSII
eukprot:SAG31_NODE_339_length_17487_cov_20.764435_13_plen_92_part_00